MPVEESVASGQARSLASWPTCRRAAPLVVHAAVLTFKLSKNLAAEFEECTAFQRSPNDVAQDSTCVSLENMRVGKRFLHRPRMEISHDYASVSHPARSSHGKQRCVRKKREAQSKG